MYFVLQVGITVDTKSLTEQTDNRIERNASFYNSNRMPFGGGKEKNRCSEGCLLWNVV